jgi:DNA-binding NarL/FixJ family response regulator
MALVLVVEDSPTEQLVISRTLQQHGFETVLAKDGEEAIIIAESKHPDVILTGDPPIVQQSVHCIDSGGNGNHEGSGDRPNLGIASGCGRVPDETRR